MFEGIFNKILTEEANTLQTLIEAKKGARCTKVTGQQSSTSKSKKYMRCARVNGKLKRIHYGDRNLRIKKSNPKRRKSFRARHKCSTAKPGTPRYYSCKNWLIPLVGSLIPLFSCNLYIA